MAPSLVGLRERSSAAWWARTEGNGTKKSPYTARHVRSLFERLELPRNLTWSSLIDGFHAAPTSNVFLVSVAGGHVRTIAPRSSRLDCSPALCPVRDRNTGQRYASLAGNVFVGQGSRPKPRTCCCYGRLSERK